MNESNYWFDLIKSIVERPDFTIPFGQKSSSKVLGFDISMTKTEISNWLMNYVQIPDLPPSQRRNYIGNLVSNFQRYFPQLYRDIYWRLHGQDCSNDDAVILYRFANLLEFEMHSYSETITYYDLVSNGLLLVNNYELFNTICESDEGTLSPLNPEIFINTSTYHLNGSNVNTTLGRYIGTSEGLNTGISGWNLYDTNNTTHFKDMYQRYVNLHTSDRPENRYLVVMKLPSSLNFSGITEGLYGEAEPIYFPPYIYKYEEQGTYNSDEYRIRYKEGVIRYFNGGSYVPDTPNLLEVDLVGQADINTYTIRVPNLNKFARLESMENILKTMKYCTYFDQLIHGKIIKC